MYYTREQHKKFLDKELAVISEEYLKKLNSKALALLADNEVYVTQFVKLDFKTDKSNVLEHNVFGAGQIMLRFKKDKGIPRKNEYFSAIVLEGKMCLPKNWGGISWGNLRRHQVEFSEVHCVWQGKTDDNGFLLCGFTGLSIEMAQFLQNKEGCVIVLGPQEPPMDYYQNLIDIVSNTDSNMAAKDILDFDKNSIMWNPTHINSDKEQVDGIVKVLETTPQLIFQGPPGTGKTYLMAELVAHLLHLNKSVLVTAMTNRALIELAEKDSLKDYLVKDRVMKTNVSSDELATCKNLNPINSKEITCISGNLTLATFYNVSGWARQCYNERPFDYVIMDEASQALFGMIAACKNLGHKTIWIGDQNQMQPIVLLSQEILIRNDYSMLANGFSTLCENFDYKSYILTETYRLLKKSAALTSIFYHTSLKSVANFDYVFKNTNISYIPKDGGTILVFKNMPIGEKADKESCEFTIGILEDILSFKPKLKIAVLTKFRASVRMLQNCFIGKYGSKENVLIDTVERVQGMTCDVCIYYIPNTMMGMSLDKSLFNVATSRAKQLTIIIADNSILNTSCHRDVHSYLLEITSGIIPNQQKETSVEQEENVIEKSNIKLHIKGKIDLSQFETQKQKAVKSSTKKNLYIIDTNVFVNCPDIISKIDSKYDIVLSAKVIDELDKLKIKLSNDEKRNVETALRLINKAMDKDNVSMELSDPNLLPEDFSRKSPDNNILTVALKFKDENPILVTSDNGLQVKAKGLKIATITLKELLKR